MTQKQNPFTIDSNEVFKKFLLSFSNEARAQKRDRFNNEIAIKIVSKHSSSHSLSGSRRWPKATNRNLINFEGLFRSFEKMRKFLIFCIFPCWLVAGKKFVVIARRSRSTSRFNHNVMISCEWDSREIQSSAGCGIREIIVSRTTICHLSSRPETRRQSSARQKKNRSHRFHCYVKSDLSP